MKNDGKPKVFLRKFAIFDKDKECTHGLGFPWTGKMPCTGVKRCSLCGALEEEVRGEK